MLLLSFVVGLIVGIFMVFIYNKKSQNIVTLIENLHQPSKTENFTMKSQIFEKGYGKFFFRLFIFDSV